MIKPLPKWVLTNSYPAIYDTESVTAIEMVAKLYGSMEEMITDYNDFVDDVNQAISDFEAGITESYEDFKDHIQNLFDDYVALINGKIEDQDEAIANKIQEQDEAIANKFLTQDGIIADAVSYMETNLVSTVTTLFNSALTNHEIESTLFLNYDSDTEELIVTETLARAEDGEY